jgi:1-pyrroline-5-carboxylate dehydrogenase
MKNLCKQFNKIYSNVSFKNFSYKLKDFSHFSPKDKHIKLSNYINGEWRGTNKYEEFPDPWKGTKYLDAPLTEKSEMSEIINLMNSCPKSGLHNPLRNVDRYLLYGQICRRVTEALYHEDIFNHFVKLIQRVFPKSDIQANAEMRVTRAFFENFSGDNVNYFILILGKILIKRLFSTRRS